jgi:hypothetical protein
MAGRQGELYRAQNRDFDATALVLEGMKTSGVKWTPGRRIRWTREISPEDDAIPPDRGVWLWDGREESHRIGVPGLGEQLIGRALLDDTAEIHHRDSMGDLPDDGEVVGNEQVR